MGSCPSGARTSGGGARRAKCRAGARPFGRLRDAPHERGRAGGRGLRGVALVRQDGRAGGGGSDMGSKRAMVLVAGVGLGLTMLISPPADAQAVRNACAVVTQEQVTSA